MHWASFVIVEITVYFPCNWLDAEDKEYTYCFNNHPNTCWNNFSILLFEYFYKIYIMLNNVNIIQNKAGDYITLADVPPKNNSSCYSVLKLQH
jgi:hypothetical protein